MEPFCRARPHSASRAEKVFAIQKAVQAGTYEIDSKKVANRLIIHLLNQAIRLQEDLLLNLKPAFQPVEKACLSRQH